MLLEPIDLDEEDIVVKPDGATFTKYGPMDITMTLGSINMRLTDRSFGDWEDQLGQEEPNDINYMMNFRVSQAIDFLVRDKKRPVNVLEAGCGPLNKAAYMISETYDEKVHVIAADLVRARQAYERPNLDQRIDDLRALATVRDNSVDVVYSFQCLTHMVAEERKLAFENILRVMTFDSYAILDIALNNPMDDGWLIPYIGEGGGFFAHEFDFHGNTYQGSVFGSALWPPEENRHSFGQSPHPYMLVHKKPEEFDILNMSDRTFVNFMPDSG